MPLAPPVTSTTLPYIIVSNMQNVGAQAMSTNTNLHIEEALGIHGNSVKNDSKAKKNRNE
jgi:hypothetical protein